MNSANFVQYDEKYETENTEVKLQIKPLNVCDDIKVALSQLSCELSASVKESPNCKN